MKPATADALFVAFATANEPGYDLQRLGTRRYVDDARFAILGGAVAAGAGPVRFFSDVLGAGADVEQLDAVMRQSIGSNTIVVAHNVHFVATILERTLGIRAARMFDTAAYARYLGLGGNLSNVASWLGYESPDACPRDAMALRSSANMPKIARHCMVSVALIKTVFQHAVDNPAFPEVEFDIVNHTAQLNQRGVRIDQRRVEKLLSTLIGRRDRELEAFTRRFAFNTTDINRPGKALAFIADQFSVKMTALDRKGDDFRRAIDAGGDLADFLLGRARLQTLSKAIKNASAYGSIKGGRVQGVLKYYGAHTGRFSAGSSDAEKVNLHGLAKGSKVLGLPELGLERTILVPGDDGLFRSADLSSIEARVVAWLAGELDLLDRLGRADEDVYSWFAGLIFPGVVITKGGANSRLRSLGKEAMIGSMFGMGLPALIKLVRTKQIPCTERDITSAYETFHDSFPLIRPLRRALFHALLDATEDSPTKIAACHVYCAEAEQSSAPTVAIELPTGRTLFYRSVRVEMEATFYGPTPAFWFAPSFGGKSKSSPSSHRHKRRRFSDGVVRARVTPQVVIENVAQAVARDVMIHQVLELERRGLPVEWHTHDEIVVTCGPCTCTGTCDSTCTWIIAGRELDDVMGNVPSTLPGLAGLPVRGELNAAVRETYAP
jgi:DNA polymerase